MRWKKAGRKVNNKERNKRKKVTTLWKWDRKHKKFKTPEAQQIAVRRMPQTHAGREFKALQGTPQPPTWKSWRKAEVTCEADCLQSWRKVVNNRLVDDCLKWHLRPSVRETHRPLQQYRKHAGAQISNLSHIDISECSSYFSFSPVSVLKQSLDKASKSLLSLKEHSPQPHRSMTHQRVGTTPDQPGPPRTSEKKHQVDHN